MVGSTGTVGHSLASELDVSLDDLIDIEQNLVLFRYLIDFYSTFLIQICRPNPNCCDEIDSSGSVIHSKVQKRPKEIEFISKEIEKVNIYQLFV